MGFEPSVPPWKRGTFLSWPQNLRSYRAEPAGDPPVSPALRPRTSRASFLWRPRRASSTSIGLTCWWRFATVFRSSDSFLERRVAVAFDHELRRPPNVDLGYHFAKAATAVDKGLRPDPAASQGWWPMAPIVTREDVVTRIAAECTFVDDRGAVGVRLEPAAAIARRSVSGGPDRRNRYICPE
jgi:hypothetical protein